MRRAPGEPGSRCGRAEAWRDSGSDSRSEGPCADSPRSRREARGLRNSGAPTRRRSIAPLHNFPASSPAPTPTRFRGRRANRTRSRDSSLPEPSRGSSDCRSSDRSLPATALFVNRNDTDPESPPAPRIPIATRSTTDISFRSPPTANVHTSSRPPNSRSSPESAPGLVPCRRGDIRRSLLVLRSGPTRRTSPHISRRRTEDLSSPRATDLHSGHYRRPRPKVSPSRNSPPGRSPAPDIPRSRGTFLPEERQLQGARRFPATGPGIRTVPAPCPSPSCPAVQR